MGKVVSSKPVVLFIGLISGQHSLFEEASAALADRIGPVEAESPVYPWNQTDYYEEEMGRDLKRRFLFFRETIRSDRLAEIKEMTNELELHWSAPGATGPRRKINLDPGYIAPSKIVLATTKDCAHRIHLARGIYAEVTMVWREGRFRPLEYTYPDFRTPEYTQLFSDVRRRRLG